jgi:heterodisulfide reductase subunit A
VIEMKLGVFLCDCGGQIGGHLDLGKLKREIETLSAVTLTEQIQHACSPDGLAFIKESVIDHGLDRVVVGGCTPRTMERHFRLMFEREGLSDKLFEMVDIREGCAWVHRDNPQAATQKAADLIRMGIARLALRHPQQPPSAKVVPAALVIGGGIAGMTAALRLANAGFPVKLVERESELGGMLRKAPTLPPHHSNYSKILSQMVEAVTHHPQIETLLETKVAGISGTVGRYRIKLNGKAVRGNGQQTFEAGVIIVATGGQSMKPRGSFGYDGQRVVTQYEFQQELWDHANKSTTDELPNKVVMILCARRHDGSAPYCSGTCCEGALKQAEELKEASPETQVTILFHDLNHLDDDVFGEELVKTRRNGVVYMRYPTTRYPIVTDGVVEVFDELTTKDHRVPYDRVVLAVPMIPQPDAASVAHMLKIPQDENGFFPQIHHRLRPEYLLDRGIYVCGAAHFPCNWKEAEFQATYAAFSAIRHLHAGKVINHAPIAIVDQARCTGCGTCVQACPFHAISMETHEGVLDRSQIDPLLCKGCGNCVVACPVKAINLTENSDQQLLAQIEAALAATRNDDRPRVLVFGCEWSSHAAAELAGVRRAQYPIDVRLIRLGCSARFDPAHALWAFLNGADGIFIGACSPGDCHFFGGNRYVQDRFHTLRNLLKGFGFDPRRLRLEWIAPDDPNDFVDKITDFTDLVSALGQSQVRSMQAV